MPRRPPVVVTDGCAGDGAYSPTVAPNLRDQPVPRRLDDLATNDREKYGLLRALGLLLIGVMLAGCATGPRSVPDERANAWKENRAQLLALDEWRADGRLVVRSPDGGGQAHFTWHEYGSDRFSLRLGGPWGQGAARLVGDTGRVELEAADGRRFAGPDARDLLMAVYGWDIPVEALRRWLVGLPTGDADYSLDRFGRVSSLHWREWSLEYRRYRQRDDLDLPAVLTAFRDDDGVELRVVVDRWQLGGDTGPAPESPVPLIGG